MSNRCEIWNLSRYYGENICLWSWWVMGCPIAREPDKALLFDFKGLFSIHCEWSPSHVKWPWLCPATRCFATPEDRGEPELVFSVAVLPPSCLWFASIWAPCHHSLHVSFSFWESCVWWAASPSFCLGWCVWGGWDLPCGWGPDSALLGLQLHVGCWLPPLVAAGADSEPRDNLPLIGSFSAPDFSNLKLFFL